VSAIAVEQVQEIAVTHGKPTAVELAAVLAVLLAAGSADTGPAGTEAGLARFSAAWAESARMPHALPLPGPHAWRASALPR
jgi:Acyl-CoA carboxylase epsilon subunit